MVAMTPRHLSTSENRFPLPVRCIPMGLCIRVVKLCSGTRCDDVDDERLVVILARVKR